MPFMNHSGLQG